MTGPTRVPIDPVKIYMNAERYRIAYLLLREAGDKDATLMATVSAPHMMISAFAIELYFKCLLCLQRKNVPQTHNLRALFRDLDNSTKKRIEWIWNQHAPTLEKLWQILEQTETKKIPRDFESLLNISSQAFHQIRYLHESSAGSFFVGDLVPILGTVILELQPTWAKLRHTPPTPLPHGALVQFANPFSTQRGGNQ
jgi:HEPN domain-containing protein